MPKLRLLVLSSVLAFGGYLAGRLASPPAAPQAQGRKLLYWHDPMHPAYRSDKPGIAPDCGMQLEPVYADGGPAEGSGGPPRPAGTVSVSGELRQLQGVRVAAVERAPATYTLRLLGRVVPDEARVYAVGAATEGTVRALSPATAGTFVSRDERLGSFFSPDLRPQLQGYLTALDVIDLDPATRERRGLIVSQKNTPQRSASFAYERLRAAGVSRRQLDEMRRTREVPLNVDVLSPVDGVVLSRGVTIGQKLERGMEWFRIANLDRVWVLADLSEVDAALATPGARARVAVPGRSVTLNARVSDVPPRFDPESRSLKLRLELENPGAALRPDMFVDVDLEIARPAAVVVPADALVDAGVRRVVFVERGEGVFEPRDVELGWRHGDRVEIARGVEAGERIVVSGTFLVDSESRIRAAAEGIHGAAAKDPVCGMSVDEAKARAAGRAHAHAGKTFFFCSDGCHEAFKASPGKFAAAGAGGAPGAPSDRGGGRHADHDEALHAHAETKP